MVRATRKILTDCDINWNTNTVDVDLTAEDWDDIDHKIIQPPSTQFIIEGIPYWFEGMTYEQFQESVLDEMSTPKHRFKIESRTPITEGLVLRALLKHFGRLNDKIIDAYLEKEGLSRRKDLDSEEILSRDYWDFIVFRGVRRSPDGNWYIRIDRTRN